MLSSKLIQLKNVYHVGTFNLKDKRKNSYEGNGVSISLCPKEWGQIARLTGETWKLFKEEGSFLDALSLNEKQEEEIKNWGAKEKLVKKRKIFKVYVQHEEETKFFLF